MSALVVQNDYLGVKEEEYNIVIAKFNMTNKMVMASIESIHQWYKMQPHLPEGALSDDRILRLLLSTSFSLEKVKQKIDNLLTARSVIPEIMMDRDPCSKEIRDAYKYCTVSVISQRLDDMTRISIIKFTPYDDMRSFNMHSVTKMGFMGYDFRLSSDLCTGDHYVFDFKLIKLGHVTQLTPTFIKKFLFILQGCFGSKIKSVHVLNVPHYAELVVSVFKAGLSKKISGRLHVHRSYESLQNHFPKNILPSDMGGENKSTVELADDLYTQLKKPEMQEWFLKQNHFKTDESKRVGRRSDMTNHLLGFQGSFRTLDID